MEVPLGIEDYQGCPHHAIMPRESYMHGRQWTARGLHAAASSTKATCMAVYLWACPRRPACAWIKHMPHSCHPDLARHAFLHALGGPSSLSREGWLQGLSESLYFSTARGKYRLPLHPRGCEALPRLVLLWPPLCLLPALGCCPAQACCLNSWPSRCLQIVCEWGVGAGAEAWLTSTVFLGMLLGAWAWGGVADAYGRRPAFLAAALMSSFCGVASAAAPSFAALLAARAGVGFGLAGSITQVGGGADMGVDVGVGVGRGAGVDVIVGEQAGRNARCVMPAPAHPCACASHSTRCSWSGCQRPTAADGSSSSSCGGPSARWPRCDVCSCRVHASTDARFHTCMLPHMHASTHARFYTPDASLAVYAFMLPHARCVPGDTCAHARIHQICP